MTSCSFRTGMPRNCGVFALVFFVLAGPSIFANRPGDVPFDPTADTSQVRVEPPVTRQLSSGYTLISGCIRGAERVVLLHGRDTVRTWRVAPCGSNRRELVADLPRAFVLGVRQDSLGWPMLEIVDKRTGRVRGRGSDPMLVDTTHEAVFFAMGNGPSVARYDTRSSRITFFSINDVRLSADDIVVAAAESIQVAYEDSARHRHTAVVHATPDSITHIERLTGGYRLATHAHFAYMHLKGPAGYYLDSNGILQTVLRRASDPDSEETHEHYLTLERGADTVVIFECDGMERGDIFLLADVDAALALGWHYGQTQYCVIIDKGSGMSVADGFGFFFSGAPTGTMLMRSVEAGRHVHDDVPVIVRYDSRRRRVLHYTEPDGHYYLSGDLWNLVRTAGDDIVVDYVDRPDEHRRRVRLKPISAEDVR